MINMRNCIQYLLNTILVFRIRDVIGPPLNKVVVLLGRHTSAPTTIRISIGATLGLERCIGKH